jgi:hypothetical protein
MQRSRGYAAHRLHYCRVFLSTPFIVSSFQASTAGHDRDVRPGPDRASGHVVDTSSRPSNRLDGGEVALRRLRTQGAERLGSTLRSFVEESQPRGPWKMRRNLGIFKKLDSIRVVCLCKLIQ